MTAVILLDAPVALLALAVLAIAYRPPEPPLSPQCLSHEDCDQPNQHNAATHAAFEDAGYRDFDGWKGAAA